ncbi:MAG: type III-B CRISPR-associated protein Cas10/Cmr2 [Thermomicrobiales bacterium]|nr:MAG: type III-B CRISPR-associated protein Cas10/Cmr2 [Thermomicrobiales bacterium]
MNAHGYLLAISIGPVQDFIAASRKTRDLWYGSELLSRCARAAADSLQNAGAQLIYPALVNGQGSTPNKLLARLPAGDPSSVAQQAEHVARQVMLDGLDRLRQHGRASTLVNWNLARAQAEQFLEFYAAWVPYDPAKPETYAAQRERVEQLLAGRKALRDFTPAPDLDQFFPARVTVRAGGRITGAAKSSLDPGRDTVFQKNGLPLSAGDPGRRLSDEERGRLGIKRGEQLDGISLLKRLDERVRFVSVVRVAMDPFIRRLEARAPEALSDLRTFVERELEPLGLAERFSTGPGSGLEQYQPFPYDCQLIFGRLELEEALSEERKEVATRFERIVHQAKRAAGIEGEIPAYVAVLHADGDRMGAAISALRTPEAHQAFSQRLSRFASEARQIVAQHSGALIYSGGDDVLAFLPLDTALACADALRRRFDQTVNDGSTGEARVTLSVGLAIGHYGEHLQELVQWSRDAEKAAKNAGRNALAVALHTRSGGGEPVTVTTPWTSDPLARWQRWIAWHREDRFPRWRRLRAAGAGAGARRGTAIRPPRPAVPQA